LWGGGLGVGGLGVGAGAQTPKPQSPIPNPQSPIPIYTLSFKSTIIFIYIKILKILDKNGNSKIYLY